MSKATPRPWVISNQFSSAGYIQIRPYKDHKGYPIAKVKEDNKFVEGEAQANTELIVRAVNCHDELVAILKAYIAEHEVKYPNMKNTLNALNDLLKRARGEK